MSADEKSGPDVCRPVYFDIQRERERQDAQWGGPAHDDLHMSAEWRLFREKFEQRAMAIGATIQEEREALIKVAALAVAQIEGLDRMVK